MRKLAKEILGDTHNLILCEDVIQCLEITKNTQIKLVLLDIESQENLNDRIAEIVSKSIKIIIIANYKSQQIAEELVSLGASGYLVKPLKAQAMLSVC